MNTLGVYLVVFSLLCKKALCVETQDVIFDDELESWHSLKRRAGYYSKSGVYKGGLYKDVRDEEFERHECWRHNANYCLEWSGTEDSDKETGSSYCRCQEEGRRYCASWMCSQLEIEFDSSCVRSPCEDRTQRARTTCSCSVESSGGRYCQEWTCTGTNSDGVKEHAAYTCQGEHESGEYCKWWTGETSSKQEVESLVCDCQESRGRHCQTWSCKERELRICKEYGNGWCQFWLAVGVAGGGGVFFVLIGLFVALQLESAASHSAILCVAIVFFCFPWTIGAAIWGGTRAVICVSVVWAIAIVASCCYLCSRRRRRFAGKV